VSASLRVTATVLRNLGVNKERATAAASSGYMNATELADYLVRKGMPFREAHEVVGKIVTQAIKLGRELEEMDLSEFGEDVYEALSLERTLAAKSQIGGTSRARVEDALEEARQRC
jgi:argininosuccinate lyase